MSDSNLRVLLPRLWCHVSAQHRRGFWLLFTLASTTAFAEVLSLSALYPFILVLVSPDSLASVPVLSRLIDSLPAGARSDLLWTITSAFIAAIAVATGFRLALTYWQTRFVNSLGSTFSNDIYRRTLHQPYKTHVSRNSSEVISVISGKVNGVVTCVLMPVISMSSSVIMLLAVMASLLVVQPVVAISMLGGFAGIYTMVALAARKRLEAEGRIVAEQQAISLKALQEGLGGIRDILIDGTQDVFCEVFQQSDRRFRRSGAIIGFIASLPRTVVEGLGMILIAVIACTLALGSSAPGGVIPILSVVALGAQRLLPLVQSIYSGWGTMKGHARALSAVLELMEQPVLDSATEAVPQSLPFQKSIELHKVGFRYRPDRPPVLKGVSLFIPKGSRVGVIGTTGSGKSTLIDLFLGLLPPSEGMITVDGAVLDSGRLRAWQKRVAHVPQSIFLSDASVAENIAFGMPRHLIDMSRVEAAARKAQIAATIDGLQHGYDTPIGERGVRLSGGQRQRLGIARALYKNADVLVLDEATSALDNHTESLVMEAVEQLDRDLTIIVIAHRLSTLRDCSMIVELKMGEMQLRGTYDQMMQGEDMAAAV